MSFEWWDRFLFIINNILYYLYWFCDIIIVKIGQYLFRWLVTSSQRLIFFFCFAFIMTWCTMSHLPDRDKGNRHFTLSFVKVYFGVIWLVDALYSRAFYFWCSQKSPRNSEDTFRTLQDQKLPVKIEGGGKRQEFWRLQRKGKNMLIFSHGINHQKK